MKTNPRGNGPFLPDVDPSIALTQAMRREMTMHAFAMPRRMFHGTSAVALLALVGLSQPVAAQCIGNPIQTNQTCTNSGNLIDTQPGIGLEDNGTLTLTNTGPGVISGTTYGIFASDGANVVNSGTITGRAGIWSGGPANVINSGTIVGSDFDAVFSNTDVTVVNSGTIIGNISIHSGAAGFGAANVTNSGTIAGTTVALWFSDESDTLTLLPGSKIIGPILLFGGNDRINIRTGNQNLTFDTLAGAIVTGTVPIAVVGNQAIAVDPTPFAMAGRNLIDFTRGVSDILRSVSGPAAANAPTATAFAADDSVAARIDGAFAGFPALAYAGDAVVFKNPTVRMRDGRTVWARGFGGVQVQDADGALLASDTIFVGGGAGVDLVARPDLRLGVFMGSGLSRLSLDASPDKTSSETVFGGLYGRYDLVAFGAPSFLDFALHGGFSNNSTSRTINNNLAPNGIEVASATYNSGYLSPELGYGVQVPLWASYTLTPSVRLRYVAGFFDSYTESGSTANLTVASRTLHVFEQRGELKLARAAAFADGFLLTSAHVGVLGIERVGDTTVNTVVLGASLPFVTPGKATVLGVLGGGGFEWRARSGVSLFGAAEAIGASDSSTVVTAKGGVRAVF